MYQIDVFLLFCDNLIQSGHIAMIAKWDGKRLILPYDFWEGAPF